MAKMNETHPHLKDYSFSVKWSDEYQEWICNPIQGVACGAQMHPGVAVSDAVTAVNLILHICDEKGDKYPKPLLDEPYRVLVNDCATNWDCDTGANGSHHPHCRACAATQIVNGG